MLVFANKQDLPNAMNAAEITDKLGLHSLRQRHWISVSTSVFTYTLIDSLLHDGWTRLTLLSFSNECRPDWIRLRFCGLIIAIAFSAETEAPVILTFRLGLLFHWSVR